MADITPRIDINTNTIPEIALTKQNNDQTVKDQIPDEFLNHLQREYPNVDNVCILELINSGGGGTTTFIRSLIINQPIIKSDTTHFILHTSNAKNVDDIILYDINGTVYEPKLSKWIMNYISNKNKIYFERLTKDKVSGQVRIVGQIDQIDKSDTENPIVILNVDKDCYDDLGQINTSKYSFIGDLTQEDESRLLYDFLQGQF